MSNAEQFGVLNAATFGTVTIGDGLDAVTIVVRALKVGVLKEFAAALKPISGEVESILAGGLSARGVFELVETRIDDVVHALAVATTPLIRDETDESRAARVAERASLLQHADVEQVIELALATISANKNFLRGRLAMVLRVAAGVMAPLGDGPTPLSPSPPKPDGALPT